jgi:hypothetical protein
MMNVQRGIVSFVLRFTQDLWQDSQGDPHLQWRGQIRHVQGNEEIRFTDLTEALAFIQRYLTQLTMDSVKGGNFKMEQDKVLRESFKLWEQFASTYSNMMFDAMERTLKQSEALKEQMDESVEKALKTWQLPGSANQDQVLEALNRLQAQVAALAEKVERLEKSAKTKL